MKLWDVTADELTTIVEYVSTMLYNGNIVFKRHPEPSGRAVAFTLTVQKSAGPAGRRSNMGRKICACCWHGHRDVMKAIFAFNPAARLKTAIADYKGKLNFEASFEETGYNNLGSIVAPVDASNACECEG